MKKHEPEKLASNAPERKEKKKEEKKHPNHEIILYMAARIRPTAHTARPKTKINIRSAFVRLNRQPQYIRHAILTSFVQP